MKENGNFTTTGRIILAISSIIGSFAFLGFGVWCFDCIENKVAAMPIAIVFMMLTFLCWANIENLFKK